MVIYLKRLKEFQIKAEGFACSFVPIDLQCSFLLEGQAAQQDVHVLRSVKSSCSQQARQLAELGTSGAVEIWKLHPLVSASELAELAAWSIC